MAVPSSISVEEFLAAAEAINPGMNDLRGRVQAFIDGGATLAQALLTIAEEQGRARKPISRVVPASENDEKRHLG